MKQVDRPKWTTLTLQVMKGWEKGMFPPDAKFPAGYHFGHSPLHPQPYTLNPTPSTLHPQPFILNPEP